LPELARGDVGLKLHSRQHRFDRDVNRRLFLLTPDAPKHLVMRLCDLQCSSLLVALLHIGSLLLLLQSLQRLSVGSIGTQLLEFRVGASEVLTCFSTVSERRLMPYSPATATRSPVAKAVRPSTTASDPLGQPTEHRERFRLRSRLPHQQGRFSSFVVRPCRRWHAPCESRCQD
jgi:hypothetical protein